MHTGDTEDFTAHQQQRSNQGDGYIELTFAALFGVGGLLALIGRLRMADPTGAARDLYGAHRRRRDIAATRGWEFQLKNADIPSTWAGVALPPGAEPEFRGVAWGQVDGYRVMVFDYLSTGKDNELVATTVLGVHLPAPAPDAHILDIQGTPSSAAGWLALPAVAASVRQIGAVPILATGRTLVAFSDAMRPQKEPDEFQRVTSLAELVAHLAPILWSETPGKGMIQA